MVVIRPSAIAFVVTEDDDEYNISSLDAAKMDQPARTLNLGTLAEAVS